MKGTRGKQAKLASLTGKGGEHIVAGQIMLRGLNVYFPAADQGADLIVENGCRIQVKTSHLRVTASVAKAWKDGVYSFHFPKRRYMATAAGETKLRRYHKFSDRCDVVVLYGIEQARYWIVPASDLDNRQAAFFGKRSHIAFDANTEDIKRFREEGYSTYEIAKKIGLSQSAVWERLHDDGLDRYRRQYTTDLRTCENAWYYILDFGKTLNSESTSEPKPAAVEQVLSALEKEQ